MVNSTSSSPTSPPSIIRPDPNRRLLTNGLHIPDLDLAIILPKDEALLDPLEIEDSASQIRYTIKEIKESVPWDDGFQWRKYGQKMLLNQSFPRHYYRCTHRNDLGCRARKQIQRVSEEPPLYSATYIGEHTCSLARAVGRPSEFIVSTLKSEQMKEQSTLSTFTTSHNSNIYGDAPSPMVASSSSYFTFDHQDTCTGKPHHVSTLEDQGLKVIPVTPSRKNMDRDNPSLIDLSDHKRRIVLQMDYSDWLLNDSSLKKLKDGLYKIPERMEYCCSIFNLLLGEYEFERDKLIQLWMAGGYIMDELMGVDLFHYVLSKEYLSCCGTNFVTRRDKYRINIKKIKGFLDCHKDNENFYLQWENECQEITNSPKIQHISLVRNDIDASIFQTLQQFNDLRTLLFLHEYGDKLTEIPEFFFQSCTKLQALDLSRTHIKKLPSSVGCMIRLCYLDLSWTLIEWLPDTVCSLEELQVLKLMGCSKLRGLPRQLKKLTKLRHLEVDVLRQLATIPAGIGALVNLRTLSAFLVGTEDGCKIQELKAMNNLTGDFCIAMLENVGNADDAKEAALNKKQHLNKLELRWTAYQLPRTNNNCYEVLDNLQPCSRLEELQIFCYQGSTFPGWVDDPKFNELVSITFFKCEHVTELPLIEQLPFLKQLELVKMNGVKKIERRGKSEQAAFFSLEKLEVDEMQSLRCWNWEKTNEDDFKSLVELSINDCPDLREFHVFPCLSSIKHLEVRGCPKIESLSETKLPDSVEDLIVEECPMIKRKYSQKGGEDWQKIKHVSNIHICEEDEDDEC